MWQNYFKSMSFINILWPNWDQPLNYYYGVANDIYISSFLFASLFITWLLSVKWVIPYLHMFDKVWSSLAIACNFSLAFCTFSFELGFCFNLDIRKLKEMLYCRLLLGRCVLGWTLHVGSWHWMMTEWIHVCFYRISMMNSEVRWSQHQATTWASGHCMG